MKEKRRDYLYSALWPIVLTLIIVCFLYIPSLHFMTDIAGRILEIDWI